MKPKITLFSANSVSAFLLTTIFLFIAGIAIGQCAGETYPDQSGTCSGEINGTVFEDLNQNGINNSGTDNVMSGITVTLFDDAGMVASTMTNNDGEYSFTGLDDSKVYRVEFTIPEGMSEGTSSFGAGTQSSSSVQFAMPGVSCSLDFAIQDPQNICVTTTNLRYTLPCYQNGSATNTTTNTYGVPTNSTSPAVVEVNYASGGKIPLIQTQAVGSTWGNGYDPATKTSYYGAVLKRHVGLGPGGIGAIYSYNKAAQGANASSVPVFYNFGATAGTVASDNTRFPNLNSGGNTGQGACGSCDNIDPTTFDQIGKVGLGDVEVGPNSEFLYVTNLNDRNVYKISLDNPAPNSAAALTGAPWLSNSGCNGVKRPWGIGIRRGKLYVGVVCDASNTSVAADGLTENSALEGYAYEYDLQTGAWSSAPVVTFPLDYIRQFHKISGYDHRNIKWVSNWNQISGVLSGVDDAQLAQPIFSDIEFDDDGSMIIGIGDRSGLQLGYEAPHPNTTNAGNTDVEIWAKGDILRAQYHNGSFIMENTEVATWIDVANNSVYNIPRSQITGLGDAYASSNPWGFCGNTGNIFQYYISHGIGGQSWYWGDHTLQDAGFSSSRDAGLGSLAMLPCSGEVLMSGVDLNTTGENNTIKLYNVNSDPCLNGSRVPGSEHTIFTNSVNLVGKSSGIGDLEILSDPPLVEIGNSVWWDDNNDGIQDPCEAPIAGVTIVLYDSNGDVVATTTTDANGRYVFTGLQPNTDYQLRIVNYQNNPAVTSSATDQGYNTATIAPTMTDAGGGGTAGAPGDYRDNDATEATNGGNVDYVISVTTGGAGVNNNTLDFGIFGSTQLPLSWLDVKAKRAGDHNVVSWITAAEVNVDHFEVELSTDNGRNFTIVGQVAANNTAQTNKYSFTDRNKTESQHYFYRITQYDVDGKSEHSKVVDVRVADKFANTMTVYPNPTVNRTKINVNLQTGNAADIKIFNATGTLMQQHRLSQTTSGHTTSIEVEQLPVGLYIIHLNQGSLKLQQRLIVID